VDSWKREILRRVAQKGPDPKLAFCSEAFWVSDMSSMSAFASQSIFHYDFSPFQEYGAESVASVTSETEGMAGESDEDSSSFVLETDPFDSTVPSGYSIPFATTNNMPPVLSGAPLGMGQVFPFDLHLETVASSSSSSSASFFSSSSTHEFRGMSGATAMLDSSNTYSQTMTMMPLIQAHHPTGVAQEPEPEAAQIPARPTTTTTPTNSHAVQLAQNGYRQSTVARVVPSRGRRRRHSDEGDSRVDDLEEEKVKAKTTKSTKQKRKTVKNAQMSISDQAIRLSPPTARLAPYIHGRCNDSRYVHVKRSSKASTPAPYELEVALPSCADQVSLNYLIIPKSASSSDLAYLLDWHRTQDLREFNGAIPLVWPKRSRRSVDGNNSATEDESGIRRHAADPNISLLRMRYHLDLPGSSASIAYLRLSYSMPGSKTTHVLLSDPFVVFTQLKQRLKGVGYFLHLLVDLNIRDAGCQIPMMRYLDAANRVLMEGFTEARTMRQIELRDLRTLLQNDHLFEHSNLSYSDFYLASVALCPLFYALRCKTRHPIVKTRWLANQSVDRVIAAIGNPKSFGDCEDAS
jgi:hypothetical protein